MTTLFTRLRSAMPSDARDVEWDPKRRMWRGFTDRRISAVPAVPVVEPNEPISVAVPGTLVQALQLDDASVAESFGITVDEIKKCGRGTRWIITIAQPRAFIGACRYLIHSHDTCPASWKAAARTAISTITG